MKSVLHLPMKTTLQDWTCSGQKFANPTQETCTLRGPSLLAAYCAGTCDFVLQTLQMLCAIQGRLHQALSHSDHDREDMQIGGQSAGEAVV